MAATIRKLDFTDVKDQGQFNRRRKPSGEYRARAIAVDDHESKEGNDNYVFTIQVDGDKRASYPYYCGLEVKQLWKLRNLFIAVGLRPPAGRAKIDPGKIVNRPFGILLDDDEYEGRLNSVIGDIFPLSEGSDFLNDGAASKKKAKSRLVEDDDEDEDEDEEPPAKKGNKKPAPVEDDEDEDEEDEPPKRPAKKSAKKKPPPVEDDDEDDEEDEDEEPPPPPKKKKKGKKARRDEDDDLETDEL